MIKNKVLIMTMILSITGISCHLFTMPSIRFEKKSSVFPRLLFVIQQESADSHMRAEQRLGTRWNGEPSLAIILHNMEKNFYEAVKYYNVKKETLPSCLWRGLDKLFSNLKKPGRTMLRCVWYKYPFVPWRSVYRQKFYLVEAEANGMSTKKQYIYLINVWKETYKYRPGNRQVRTSSILMHELIHCVKKHYPDCFKELENPKEEGTTEGGEMNIYGKNNCGTGYRDQNGWNFPCTYENVCICKTGCPDEEGNILK